MDTITEIKRIISEQTGVSEENITDSTTIEDVVADSLDIVEILMEIEESFDIDIPDSDAEKLSSIGDLCTYIEERLNA